MESRLSKSAQIRGSIFSTGGDAWLKIDIKPAPLMKQIPKTELSPDNGCIIDMKWKLGSLGYHPSAAGKEGGAVSKEIVRLPELVLYDHIGFKGAYARTNLSFHYIGDFRSEE